MPYYYRAHVASFVIKLSYSYCREDSHVGARLERHQQGALLLERGRPLDASQEGSGATRSDIFQAAAQVTAASAFAIKRAV
jgi:hypothetical protein